MTLPDQNGCDRDGQLVEESVSENAWMVRPPFLRPPPCVALNSNRVDGHNVYVTY